MRIALPGRPHLSYCTNIHPAESLDDVRRVLESHVVKVRERVCPSERFGVGLRLSARAAEELSSPEALDDFRELLRRTNAYVFTINGFPYGAFHGTRVKDAVYLPDWTDEARVAYSNRLATVLAALLPDGTDGSVSTVPGAFAARARRPEDRAAIADGILRHVATLWRLREHTGKSVELALEPEPCCLLETVEDTCRFFAEFLFAGRSVGRLASLTGLSRAEAEAALRRHLGVCFDACHFAVEFEDARDAIERLTGAGIRIGKIQITDALVARFRGEARSDAGLFESLERFSDDVYLHQVVERRHGALERFVDLPEAFEARRGAPANGPFEWRIHFHVPVFSERLGPFGSTQPFLRDLFGVLRERAVTDHLEVETYTWDVLPPEHRATEVDEAIARELSFTVGLATAPPPHENGA